jgi:glycosyltransferase involved in cell wall biosynthesis
MPKVSVIIPTYNRAHLITETIESVITQTFRDFEIIVIDDGSTDNTGFIASAFPVRYLRQENRGVSSALNKGIEMAQGEYITFLGSDDILIGNALEKGVKILDAYTEVGFSFGQVYTMDRTGLVYGIVKSSLWDHFAIIDGKELIREMLSTYRIPIITTMVRRCCLDKVGGFSEEIGNIAEDIHFIVRLAKRCTAAYIAEPLAKSRIHSASLSRNVDPRSAEKAFLLILKEIFGDVAISPYFQRWKRQTYSKYYQFIANYAYGKDMKLARQYLRKALIVYPQNLFHKEGLSIAYMYSKSFLPNMLRLSLKDSRSHFLRSKKHLLGPRKCQR